MNSHWLLDTSALLALRDDEDGAERVAQLLQAARSGESRCLVCFMSRMEVLDADHLGALQRCPPGAGRCHQGLPSPLAGRCLDRRRRPGEGAVLVHKDPEFRALDQVAQEWLG
jgi:hypothetical protein